MKRHLRATSILGILSLAAFTFLGCPMSHFGWVYSIGSNTGAGGILRSPQGGYFLTGAGHASDAASSPYCAMFLKLSDTGEMEWHQFVSGMRGSVGAAVPDGGLILATYSGTSAASYQSHITLYTHSAELVWTYAYGEMGRGAIFPSSAVATSDGGCVFAGRRYNGNEELPFVLKLDPQGGVVWERHMAHEVGFLNVAKLVPVGDEGFIVSGLGRLGAGRLLRIDSEGNPLWWKDYDGTWVGNGFAVAVAQDGGFVLAGSPWKSDDTCVPVVIRTDADGNVLWTVDDVLSSSSSTYMSTYYTAHDMLVDGDGRIVIVGEKRKSFYNGIEWQVTGSGYIMQLSSTGHLNWYKSLSTGPYDTQTVTRVTLTASGDYITLGQTASGIQVIRVSTAGKIM